MRKQGLSEQHERFQSRMKTAAGLFVLLICVGFCTVFIWKLLHPQEAAFQRQDLEESLADAYLKELFSENREQGLEDADHGAQASDPVKVSEGTQAVPLPSDPELSDGSQDTEAADNDEVPRGTSVPNTAFSDDVYYNDHGFVYTPEYASGHIDCVLEIAKPSVQIRRGVYTGTNEEIAHDLSIWMVTAARSDYIFGKTHYVIYGHNTDTQDLSFNRLKYLDLSDSFLLYRESGVYEYTVTKRAFYGRTQATEEIVDNFLLPHTKVYILTCAQGEHNGQDLVIEGTLANTYTLAEWAKTHSEEYHGD